MRALLTLFFGFALTSHAGSILVIFSPSSTLDGQPGQTLDFVGTLTDTDPDLSAPEYINSDSYNLVGLPLDDSPFLSNAPIFLIPGQVSNPFLMFRVPIPVAQPLGLYSGTFTVIGGQDGGDGSAQQPIGTGNFTVNVVPEPSTTLLLGAGLITLLRCRRKRT